MSTLNVFHLISDENDKFIYILYNCMDYSNKFEIRKRAIHILFRIIDRFEINDLHMIPDTCFLELFKNMIDLTSLDPS
jgi:hypothetical protein